MSERREAERHAVPLMVARPPEEEGAELGVGPDPLPPNKLRGVTRDLSALGMYVETAQRPEVGAETQVAIVWGEEWCVYNARVVRHGHDGVGLKIRAEGGLSGHALREILDSDAA